MGPNTQGAARLVELTELYVAAKVIALGEHGKGMKPDEAKALVVEALNLAQEMLGVRNAIMADAAARDTALSDTIERGDPSVELHEQTVEELQVEHDATEVAAQADLDKDLANGAAQTGDAPLVPDTERPAAPDAAPLTGEAPTN